MTFGEKMLALMADRGLSLRKLSKLVHYDDGYLSKVSRDLHAPSPELAKQLDEALDADGGLEALAPQKSAPERVSKGQDEDEEMERRRLLQALATLGAASAPVLDALGNIRTAVDHALDRGEESHLAEWEETIAEYGHSYSLMPPGQLLRDLAADLVAVQQIASRRSSADRSFPSWCRITGGLAVLMAKTLCNLGHPRQAREWWITAQNAAETSGDLDLSLWIEGERLVHGLYARRPPAVLLRTADQILERSSESECRGLVHVRTVRAQLLALEGQAPRAQAELHRCEELFGRLPASVTDDVRSVAGWAEDRLRYTAAWVHAHLGQLDLLDQAAERARTLLPAADLRVHAQLDLLRAFGHVRAGDDAAEGVRSAHAVYSAQPVEHRTVMVSSLAEQVLEAVPSQSRNEPAVADYREMLMSGDGRKAIT